MRGVGGHIEVQWKKSGFTGIRLEVDRGNGQWVFLARHQSTSANRLRHTGGFPHRTGSCLRRGANSPVRSGNSLRHPATCLSRAGSSLRDSGSCPGRSGNFPGRPGTCRNGLGSCLNDSGNCLRGPGKPLCQGKILPGKFSNPLTLNSL